LITLDRTRSLLPHRRRTLSRSEECKGGRWRLARYSKGETLGLVGESGCGKSTLGKGDPQIDRTYRRTSFYNGKDLAHLPQSAMREQRKHLQMIFQDPYASLNPRMTVGNIIGEPIPDIRSGEREVGE
jgi:ABC-type microcin C transport system duplicated ATPase subunit YejF